MEEKGIFEGLKVLDCASFIAAPAAATVLSDFGADVIKIEPPGAGDPYRNLPNLPGYPHSEHNFAWMLEARNKRSLALDLSKPEGQAVLHKLAAEADVFITNYPPQVRARLGITHDHLAPHNERLIYASFTGYGEKGEEANKPGFDSNAYWARSGLMDLVRADEHTTPARSVAGMGDHPCAMAFYGAIVTALYKRERTGKGSHVVSNLMANGIWAASVLAQAKLVGAKFLNRGGPREEALNAVTNHYQCKDGRWLILSLLNEDRQWPTLAKCLGREDLITDARFAAKKDRHARSLELVKIFDEVFASKDLAEWRKILDGNGLVFGVVGILDDIPNDKQMIENEVLVPFENDTMLTINSPIWVDGSQEGAPRKPPGIGEHSDEILRNAGYDEACDPEIARVGRGGVNSHRHADLSPALFPGIGKQLQARADADAVRREFEPVWTDFGGGVTRTPEWRRDVNPMGEIPVLEVDGEADADRADPAASSPSNMAGSAARPTDEKFELLRWLFWDNHKLTGYMATYRFMRTFTPSPDPQVLKYFRRRLDDFLGILEQHLQETRLPSARGRAWPISR